MGAKISPQAVMPNGDPYPTLGPIWCAWIETTMRHGEGDYQGDPVKLDPFQRLLLYRLGEYDPTDVDHVTGQCKLLVEEALIVTPQGCGKTPFAGWLADMKLLGPAVPTANGPKMRPAPNIPLVSASLGLTKRLYQFARDAIEAPGSPLKPYVDGPYELEMHRKDEAGTIWRPAASGLLQEGGAPTDVIVEELHTAEKRSQITTIQTILKKVSKRANAQVIYITTPDDADPQSMLGKLMLRAEKVLSGEVSDPSFFVAWWTCEHDDVNLDDPEQLREHTAEATPATWPDIDAVARLYETGKLNGNDYRRYCLGQFVRSKGYWLPGRTIEDTRWEVDAGSISEYFDPDEDDEFGQWLLERARELGKAPPPPKGTPVVLVFDGSYNRDSTALTGTTLEGYSFVVDMWERPDDAPETWHVPRSEVLARVQDAMRYWRVVELCPDPSGWHEEVEGWEDTYEDVVVRFEVQDRKQMAEAVNRFYSAAVQGEWSHDGDPRLERHLRNAVPKRTTSGTIITKEHPDSPRKIDAALTVVVGNVRAAWHASEGLDSLDDYAAYVVGPDDDPQEET